jgi:hypothetical protein
MIEEVKILTQKLVYAGKMTDKINLLQISEIRPDYAM